MVEFVGSYPRLVKSDLESVERELDLTLPDDIKELYLRSNGGSVVPGCFPRDGELFCIQLILPMKAGNRDVGFEETYRDLVGDPGKFPDGFIPFAIDEAGDYFIYSLRSDDFGSIHFNQSDYYDDPDRFTVFLAEDLESFLRGLTEEG